LPTLLKALARLRLSCHDIPLSFQGRDDTVRLVITLAP
jgi:hypothetical protein